MEETNGLNFSFSNFLIYFNNQLVIFRKKFFFVSLHKTERYRAHLCVACFRFSQFDPTSSSSSSSSVFLVKFFDYALLVTLNTLYLRLIKMNHFTFLFPLTRRPSRLFMFTLCVSEMKKFECVRVFFLSSSVSCCCFLWILSLLQSALKFSHCVCVCVFVAKNPKNVYKNNDSVHLFSA